MNLILQTASRRYDAALFIIALWAFYIVTAVAASHLVILALGTLIWMIAAVMRTRAELRQESLS
jgi:hypothetical protein